MKQVLYLTTINGRQLLVYDIDADAGTLTVKQTVALPAPAGPMTVSKNRERLYVGLNDKAADMIQSYRVDKNTGLVTLIGSVTCEGFPTYLDVDHTGRYLVAAYYSQGKVEVYRVNDDGSLVSPVHQTVAVEKHAHAFLMDPSNQFGFVPHINPNAMYQFHFDEKTGLLSANEPVKVIAGGTAENPDGPRHYVYHPDLSRLNRVYAVNERGMSVSVYEFNRESGTLTTRLQDVSTMPDGHVKEPMDSCADIHITPDGRFVYASNRGLNSIAAYRVNQDDGQLTRLGIYQTESWPREFEIDHTGRYMFVAGERSHHMSVYAIDQATGELSLVTQYETPEGPIWVWAMRLGKN